ncbi:XRE family transcriptional regulator [uncultured Bifidobacterium sp.]|uniref:XRE family transcriptional regulator n=1 Tax=Bifidobacterium bifidum TaxID=1681 RepID=UPI00258641E8|nr:XRE family transcriptional regulator [uncultured Bifidobacterium sp.]
MSEPMNVTAVAERSGNWWAVEVPEIPGLFTQARRLDQIDGMVRDAARMLGREVGMVTVDPKLSEEDERMIDELLAARREATEARAKASRLTAGAVDALRGQGMTVRDVADIIGITPQRVSALANA